MVANAVAAITEINETRTLIEINLQTVNKLLTALNECTEWGQVFILDALANYQPKDEREAQNICERICPRLAHANAAVVLSTVKGELYWDCSRQNYIQRLDNARDSVQLGPKIVRANLGGQISARNQRI